ncbi:MAG TPA: Ig-like domain-containing protein [Pseudogracilibacillus sp.]|nr:Ig-like domain-containing protein [Pseudogracilibacillus sp.]
MPPVKVTGVTVAPKTNNLEVGATRQLNVTIEPSNADNQEVTFVSNDEAVATVDSDGLVTANSEGTATITVTTDDGGLTDTASINVTLPTDPEG